MTTNRRVLTAYLTPLEYELAQQLAEKRKTTLSKLVIRLIRDESSRLTPQPETVP